MVETTKQNIPIFSVRYRSFPPSVFVLKGEEVIVPIDGPAQAITHGLIAMPQRRGAGCLVDICRAK